MRESLRNQIEAWLEAHKHNVPDVTSPEVWEPFLRDLWKRFGAIAKLTYQHAVPVLEKGLVLYYTVQDPAVPKDVRLKIAAALAYLISPIDIIPDPTPFIGHLDDLFVLAVTTLAVESNITEEAKKQSKEAVEEIVRPGATLAA